MNSTWPRILRCGTPDIGVTGSAKHVTVSGGLAESLRISGHDLLIAVTLGVVQLAFQYILITTGSRYVPAAEVALLGRTATGLAPIWVWIGVGEVPSNITLIGGAVVLSVVAVHSVYGLNARPAEPAR